MRALPGFTTLLLIIVVGAAAILAKSTRVATIDRANPKFPSDNVANGTTAPTCGVELHSVAAAEEDRAYDVNLTTSTVSLHTQSDILQTTFFLKTSHYGGVVFCILALLVVGYLLYLILIFRPVYLMAFSTFKAPDSWKVTHAQVAEILRRQGCFTPDSLSFLSKTLERSATGQATALPPGITRCLEGKAADRSTAASRMEAETIICDVVENALKRAKLHPRDIDVLVINCSAFSPTPSLCALVMNKFGMRSDVSSYNISGMGCAASLIGVELAANMIQQKSSLFGGSRALLISTEIITPHLYPGNERSFLLQNTLFRCGGAAVVLSTKWGDGMRAWYRLLRTVRVQGTDEKSYSCVFETEDSEGHRGVTLSKEIVKVAGKCMEKNLRTMGASILPMSELIKVVATTAACFSVEAATKVLSRNGKETWAKKLPVVLPYFPNFKSAVQHFCIHAGGRAIIDGVEKGLQLEPVHTEASRMTLMTYGNTSSSSIWYELEYIQDQQKKKPLKKGDCIMQVAFGSGFKCTSGAWLKL